MRSDEKVLAGKIALVTGAANGIGKNIADELENSGARVVRADLYSSDDIRELDVRSVESWIMLENLIDRDFGRLDILVNNAGVHVVSDIESMSIEGWRNIFSVNVEGIFLGTKHMLSMLKKSDDATIINMGSVAGKVGVGYTTAYSASKASVIAFTRSSAVEFSRKGYKIRVNSISPGMIETDLLERAFPGWADAGDGDTVEDTREHCLSQQLTNRFGKPSDISALVTLLSSSQGSFFNGSDIVVDGGYIAR